MILSNFRTISFLFFVLTILIGCTSKPFLHTHQYDDVFISDKLFKKIVKKGKPISSSLSAKTGNNHNSFILLGTETYKTETFEAILVEFDRYDVDWFKLENEKQASPGLEGPKSKPYKVFYVLTSNLDYKDYISSKTIEQPSDYNSGSYSGVVKHKGRIFPTRSGTLSAEKRITRLGNENKYRDVCDNQTELNIQYQGKPILKHIDLNYYLQNTFDLHSSHPERSREIIGTKSQDEVVNKGIMRYIFCVDFKDAPHVFENLLGFDSRFSRGFKVDESISEIKALPSNVKIHGLPNSLSYKIKKRSNGSLEITFIDQIKDYIYITSDLGNNSVPSQYRYLINKHAKHMIANVTISSTLGNTSIPIKYFDYEVVFSKIKEIEIEKRRIANLGDGHIKLTANMDEVDVFINNKKVGLISKGQPFVTTLKEGGYQIQARKNYFGSKTIRVKIEKNDLLSYNFELKPSGNLAEEIGSGKIVQSIGELIVVTKRNDLSVLINGETIVPPFKLPNMPSGKYNAIVSGPNGKISVEIIVKENSKSYYDLDKILSDMD